MSDNSGSARLSQAGHLPCLSGLGGLLQRHDHFIGPDHAQVAADQFIGEIGVGALGVQQHDVPLQRGAALFQLLLAGIQCCPLAADIVQRQIARRAKQRMRAEIEDNEQAQRRKRCAFHQIKDGYGLHNPQNHARTAPSRAWTAQRARNSRRGADYGPIDRQTAERQKRPSPRKAAAPGS